MTTDSRASARSAMPMSPETVMPTAVLDALPQRRSLQRRCDARAHSRHACMQGNCVDPPPSAVALQLSGNGLAPRRGNQCVLTTPVDTIQVNAGNVWLDSLYLRLRTTGVTFSYPGLISSTAAGRLWMTNITMQGDGDATCRGLSCEVAAGALIQGTDAPLACSYAFQCMSCVYTPPHAATQPWATYATQP